MAITVGSVEVDVVPNTKGIHRTLTQALVPAGEEAGEAAGRAAGERFGPAMASAVSDSIGLSIGQKIGEEIANAIKNAIKDALKDGVQAGGKQAAASGAKAGEETGGAFARAMKARMQAAFRSLPKIDIDADTSEADADLQALRVRMESLANKNIGVDIDATAARAEIDEIEAELTRLGAAHPDVTVRADTAKARADLAGVREEIDRISANPGHIRLETDGTLGQKLRAAVAQAEASLPNINIDADTTPAEVEIARLRGQLTSLKEAKIGIDIDAGAALAQITEIQARLARLSASSAGIAVRVDAATAEAQLAAVGAMATALDAKRVNINVSAAEALAAIFQLTIAIAGLAVIPAIPVLAAGIGSIAAAGVAAGVGVGALAAVAIPAFKGIASTLQAQKAAQDAATAATMQGGQASGQGAAKALQLAGAQQALASAHRNAARQIGQAEQAVGDAVRNSAQANLQAAKQVTAAKQSLADAVQQAADRQQQAEESVSRAEDSLADAQKQSKQAQLDLTQARKDAAAELADLANSLVDAQLSERDSVLDVQEARLALQKVQAKGSTASTIEQQRAQLALDQALQRLKEQQQQTKSLSSEKAAADKAGVEGSATVQTAQQRLADAEKGVADQQQGLAKARADASKQQIQNQRDIASAQEKVAEASRNVSKVQEDGARSVQRAQESLVAAQQSAADSIASAQRQIQSASTSAAGGIDQAAVAQAKYQAELAKLTPAARGTLTAFTGLKAAFGDWSKSLQPKVMPIFTRALDGIRKALPGLTPFVEGAVRAITKLQDKVSQGFKSPWWKTFKGDLAKSVEPALTGLGISFGRIFKGIALVIGAFLPHMGTISDTMQRITGKFSTWAVGLKGSPAFERFLSYSAEMAPVLSHALGSLFTAVLSIAKSLAPIATILYTLLGGVFRFVGSIADTLPWLIQGIYLVIIAMKLWTVSVFLFNAVMDANPIVLIVIAIVALVAGIVYAYKKFDWFRNSVQLVWAAVRLGAQLVVDWFTGPFKRFFTVTIPSIFWSVINWVKKNWPWILGALTGPIGLATVYIVKHWNQISAGFSAGWGAIKRNVLSPLQDFFTKKIPGWAGTLRDRVIDAFNKASAGMGKAWGRIQELAKKPVKFVIDHVYNQGIVKTWNLVAKAFGAPPLAKMPLTGWATGGVLPGYTPGKDVHKFYSPTGGGLELSGGEAIMRPEFTRALGSKFIGTLNKAASTRGAQGVKAALAPALGGNPTPTQQFADGGIFGWIGKAVSGVGSKAWDAAKGAANWLTDGLEASARAGVKVAVDPLLARFPGADTGFGKMVRQIPTKMIDSLFGYSKTADKKGAGGVGGPRIAAGLKWAKTQAGLPYQWGGNGNPSWDCSGLVSAIESVIRGEKPHRRWATGSFSGKQAPPGWTLNAKSPYRIGVTNAGVGHTAGTIAGTNVESRGGQGVIVGPHARGWNDPLFGSHYGFTGKYDQGGYLQPGMNLAYNGTGKPEPVLTAQQAKALTTRAFNPGSMSLDGQQMQLVLDDGRSFAAHIETLADGRIQTSNNQLMQVINAGGGS